jgi:hypothetical protein
MMKPRNQQKMPPFVVTPESLKKESGEFGAETIWSMPSIGPATRFWFCRFCCGLIGLLACADVANIRILSLKGQQRASRPACLRSLSSSRPAAARLALRATH